MFSKYNHLYDTSQLSRNVKRKSINGGIAILVVQFVLLVIGLIRGGILARFLSPTDYGAQAMIMGLVSLAIIYKDLGLSTAIIREKHITHYQVSNLFWINACVGLASAMVVCLMGPVVAWFYNRPELTGVTCVLSLSYLFSGLSVQTQALMKRQMFFGKQAVVDIIANVCASVVGLYLAIEGYGYWALIWMQVATSLFAMCGYLMCVRWIPSLPMRGVQTLRMIKVGGDVAGLNVFATLTKNADSILLGKLGAVDVLGLYSRALMLQHLVEGQLRNALSSVALPGLSAVQNDNEQFKSYFLRYVQGLAVVTMFAGMFLSVFAEEVIHYYLGRGWVGVVPYLEVMGVSAMISSVIICPAMIPLTLGYSRRYLWTGVAKGISRMLGIVIGVIGWRGMGAAYGLVISDLILFYPYLRICLKGSTITVREFNSAIISPFLIVCVTGAVVLPIKRMAFFRGVTGDLVHVWIFISFFCLLYVITDWKQWGIRLRLTNIFHYCKKA